MQEAKHHYFPLRCISLAQTLKQISGMINTGTQASTAQICFSYEFPSKHHFKSLRLLL